MNQLSQHAALAALRHWAAHAAGQPLPAAPTDAGFPLVHQAAWLLLGQSAPAEPWPALPSAPLQSIFDRRNDQSAQATFLRPAPLRIDAATLFPTLEAPAATLAAADQAALQSELAALETRDLPLAAKLEAALFALQRYAWALPSPLPAVSLYDFARIHAALAAALHDNPAGTVCLVGGDLSGVQEFIYTIPAAGAAKQLRGRSLYLQLLTDASAHYVLTQTGMPLCNLLYAGGGRFYALLPGTAVERMQQWRRDLGRHLLAAHHGALYLALGATTPFAPTEYAPETWQELSDVIEADKRRRFVALDADAFARLFKPFQPPPPRDDGVEEVTNAMGDSLAKLGQRLGRAEVLVAEPIQFRPFDGSERDSKWYEVLQHLGLRTQLLAEEPAYRPGAGRYRRVLRLTDDDAELQPQPGDIIGTRYTVTEARRATDVDVARYKELGLTESADQEMCENDVLPFNYLAACSRGVERIGVLRMDVDDLGDLFGKKLDRPNGIGALAYTAALSAALSRFFEGWVGALCRQFNEENGSGIYAVYSGGDDLFLVGSWNLMPALAQTIRDDFARYVLGRPLNSGERPPITLSAGITLHNAGYPLYQAADDAGEALDAAKAVRRGERGEQKKNAISFLGRSLTWEEFAEAAALQAELTALIDAGAPRGLLMVIQSLVERALGDNRRTRSGERQLSYGPWIWQGAYQFTRMAERAQGDDLKLRISTLRERLLSSAAIQARTIERAGLAARWAQLLVRGEGARGDRELEELDSLNEMKEQHL